MIRGCGDDRLGYESKVGGFICVGADLANGDFHGGPRVTLSSPTVGGISRWEHPQTLVRLLSYSVPTPW